MDVFRYAETRWRILIMVCIWFFAGVVYYGISLNAVNLGLNVYMSVFVNGFIEIPAFFISAVLLGKLGRKAVLVGAMALSGVCYLVGSFFFVLDTPEGLKGGNGLSFGGSSRRVGSNGTYVQEFYPTDSGLKSSGILMGILRLSCGVIGIFGMAGTYNLIYIYTTELFPTVVRNAALGLAWIGDCPAHCGCWTLRSISSISVLWCACLGWCCFGNKAARNSQPAFP
ncbi:unnamed protein product [Calypogeia fissa]